MKKNLSNIFKFILAVFIGITCCYQLRAQRNIFKEYETTTINISNDSLYLRFSIYNDNPKVRTKKSLAYFWFKSNKIFMTKGGFYGKLLHGDYISFFVTDQMLEKGKYKKGVKQGEWMLWNRNGSINKVVNWKDGRLHGITRTYKGDKVLTEKNYDDGKLLTGEKSDGNFLKRFRLKIKVKRRSKNIRKVKT